MGKADLDAVFLFWGFFVVFVFSLRRGHCMTFNKCSLNPEVFEYPFYSIPSIKFGIVKNSSYH